MLIDSHCHLDFPELADDRIGVLSRAREAGVGRLITIATSIAKYDAYRAIAEENEDVWFTIGVHPHHANAEPDTMVDDIIRKVQHPRCVGIGEAGLDYHYDDTPHDVAERVFRTHIAAARETGLPLVIHSRDADADMARILRDEMGKGAFKAVLHCFTSGASLAKTGVDLGLSLSFSGVLTFKNSDTLRAIAGDTPLDRLLVETDAPFLAPVPYRGKRNEPAFVAATAAKLAEVKGVSEEDLAAATTANAVRLFSKMPAIAA